MDRIIDAAVTAGVYVSIGYSERDEVNGTLYNSNMMISPEGEALNHRKLKPTGSERVIWGDANKDYFPVMDTPWGPMANLICWESYMPLARVALYEKGISLYISPNTNDNEEWQNTIRHIAIEGHCYFINCNMIIRKSSYPKDLNEYNPSLSVRPFGQRTFLVNALLAHTTTTKGKSQRKMAAFAVDYGSELS